MPLMPFIGCCLLPLFRCHTAGAIPVAVDGNREPQVNAIKYRRSDGCAAARMDTTYGNECVVDPLAFRSSPSAALRQEGADGAAVINEGRVQ